jgi:ubiquinone/menaquinone biosynthesis C-methylase UbiE
MTTTIGQPVRVSNWESSTFWDGEAASFDDEADHGLRDPAVREAWRRLLRAVLPEPPADIADIGCGTGSLSVLLAQDGYRVTGVDMSANMVAAATRKAMDAGLRVAFRQGDASDPDLARSSVDAVVVRHVTWALSEPDEAVRRWVALLREGGRLILIEGRWATGAGITARQLVRVVRSIVSDIEVQSLTDQALWGAPMVDERYLLIART